MKNRVHFENLMHFILLFLMFLAFMTIFISMKNNEVEEPQVIDYVGDTIWDSDFDIKVSEGKKLFKTNCGSCHASDMYSDLTGPGLNDVKLRWKGKEKELYDWVRNSQKYLVENPDDKYVQKLYLKYAKNVMTPFPNLKNEDIDKIFAYVEAITNQ